MSETRVFRVHAYVVGKETGNDTHVSFIVRGAGIRQAVDDAHGELDAFVVVGDVTVDEITGHETAQDQP